MTDPRKANFRWGDAEVDGLLHKIAVKEQELLKVLANYPETHPQFTKMRTELENITNQRIQLEKIMFNRADFD